MDPADRANGVSSSLTQTMVACSKREAILTFLDFFAGAGLVRLGLEPSWSCIWANDIDAKKKKVYEAHFGAQEFILGDVEGLVPKTLPVGADMAWASFPCQDLSLAGWRRGMKAERSGTYWAFWRLMRELFLQGKRPPIIAIENVTGILYGRDFLTLCQSLADLGMQFGPLVIDARRFPPTVSAEGVRDCRGFSSRLFHAGNRGG